MKSFAAALALVASSNAVYLEGHHYAVAQPYALPQYGAGYQEQSDAYTPLYANYHPYVGQSAHYGKDARSTPLLADTQALAYAWARPYWPSDYARTTTIADCDADYEEAKKLVAGACNVLDYQEKKIAGEMKRMPKDDYVEDYAEEKDEYEPEYQPAGEPLPVYMTVTPYEWYAQTGQCELTDLAYGQCVSWKQSSYRQAPVIRQTYGEVKKGPKYGNVYEEEVTKVKADTGMAYQDRKYTQGQYALPSYGRLEHYTPRDLYTGTSVLPVEITDSYGRRKQGQKVVTDNYDDTKHVTIGNESSGLANTLKLKDSQKVMHVQEVDQDGDYIDDMQLITVCDDETYTCDVVALNLDSPALDPAYVDHAYEEIDYAAEAYPHESASEPTLIDPLSVGANEDDVCWLEDLIIGTDSYGNDMVETEVFCAAADDLYVEPLANYQEDSYADDYVDDSYAGDDYTEDTYEDVYEEPYRPPKPTGFPSKPRAKPAKPY